METTLFLPDNIDLFVPDNIPYEKLKNEIGRQCGIRGSVKLEEWLDEGLTIEQMRERCVRGRLNYNNENGKFYLQRKNSESRYYINKGEVLIIYPDVKRVRVC